MSFKGKTHTHTHTHTVLYTEICFAQENQGPNIFLVLQMNGGYY